MKKYDKKTMKKLRELGAIAYERELDQALSELDASFKQWRAKEIDGFELSDLIHKFHDGKSRDLYKYYHRANPEMAVSRALVLKILRQSEIPANVYEQIAELLKFFKADFEEDTTSPIKNVL